MKSADLIVPDIMKDSRYLAHTRKNAETKEVETLLAHSRLTLHYYQMYCEKKKMDDIVKGLIASCGFGRDDIQTIYLLFRYAIFLHDAGKINPRYQYEVLGNKQFAPMSRQATNSHHALASAYFYIDHMYQVLPNNQTVAVKKCLAAFAYCIYKHHGKLDNGHDFSALEIWDEEYFHSKLDSNIFQDVRYYMQESEEVEQPINFYLLCRLLYALITGCDYCATQEFMTGHSMEPVVIENGGKDLKKCYDESSISRGIRQFQKEPAAFKGDPINRLRNQLFLEAEHHLITQPEAHIYYLEAPTGAGKTNMAINLTLRVLDLNPDINNIFYIFPFNTLVEQTKKTLLPFFGDQLAVINSITPVVMGRDDRQDKYEAAWLDHIFNNYPIVLTSHINFFNALFGCGRDQCFPLLKLCNSVVILDEIQSYKNSIWREMISFLQCYAQQLHIKIIMMSATLPKLDQLLRKVDAKFTALVEEPQKYYRDPLFKNRVRLDFSLMEKGEITLEELKEKVLVFQGKRVLVEFIKKKTAKEFYDLLKDKGNAVLLTGDDNAARREQIIQRINSGEKLILVATQVIEAGINIDMEIGFKDISLPDAEEQFMGRINRSCLNDENSVAYFFDLDDASFIYRGDARLNYSIKDLDIRKNVYEKRFGEIYTRVFEDLIAQTSKSNEKNLANLDEDCAQFNCKKIEKQMRLIERNWQLFIPYIWEDLDGYQVWEEFKALGNNRDISYSKRMVEYSKLALMMSYFTFSVFRDKIPPGAEEYGGYYFIDGGERFVKDGILDREALEECYGGIFL